MYSITSRTAVMAAIGLMAVVGCQPKNEYAAPPPPQVEVSQPVEQPVTDYLEFTGTTRSVATVDLRARVNGYLEGIHFEDGGTVEQGQLLFTIEKAPFETKLAMAEAELAKARAELELAEAELLRLRTLVRRDAGTAQDLDIRQAQRDSAVANVAAATAAVDDAKLQLNYCEVRAPISGRIGQHLVDVGNLVQAEQTPLAMIERFDPIYTYFNLSEGDLLEVRRERSPGARTSALLGDGERTLEMGLGGEDGYPHQGKLDFTALGVDPGTGTLQLRGIFENEDRTLLPGLFARVRTAVGEATPRLLVPERAVGVDQSGDYVLVVGDENIVEHRSVKLGRTIDEMRVVISGLEGEEWIVVNGVQFARPGAPVDPQRPDDGTSNSEAVAASEAEQSEEPVKENPKDETGDDQTAAAKAVPENSIRSR